MTLSRRNMLLSATYTALVALTGCKLRIENPLDKAYPYRMTFRMHTGPYMLEAINIDGVRYDMGVDDG